MSSAIVTLVGTIKDNDSAEERQVTITGLADIIGMSPGSPPPRPHPQPPLGIWGPTDPRPSNPISGIPGLPGYSPPLGIWGPPGPWPTPPIAGIPGLPGYTPPEGGGAPKFEVKVGWTAETGWVVVLVPAEGTLVPTPSK